MKIPYIYIYKVVPQFGIAKLVPISPITVGLMNGGYIELVFMGIINQLITGGAPPCIYLVGGLEPWNFMTFHSVGNFIIPTDELHNFSEG